MPDQDLQPWQHDHVFGQDERRPGERRTLIVIVITATMMVVEIWAGLFYGSMALLADGLHMMSHTVALGITAFAYMYARRHADDERYSFGTGKVNSLAGFTGAILLAVFAVLMVWESVERLLHPVDIVFNQAILVAVLGLAVNGASAVILGHRSHGDGHSHAHSTHGEDHNLRSAYLHVIADALTSVLAICALLAGKYYGLVWMDPAMGIVGAILVGRWSLGLARMTSAVLLDQQGPEHVRESIRESVEQVAESRVVDLHLWTIGPGLFATEIVVVTAGETTADEYKSQIPIGIGLAHITIEVQAVDADSVAESVTP